MANLEELASEIRNDGYSEVNAEARLCQDIVLKAIAQGSLSRNVTVNRAFSDRQYRQRITRSRRANWLGIQVTDAFEKITAFLGTL